MESEDPRDNTQTFDLTASFELNWNESEEPPDIAEFLVQFPAVGARDIANLLLFDLQRRAAARRLIPVECYPCWSLVCTDLTLKWEVVQAEICHSRTADDPPPLSAFIDRFPEFSSEISALERDQSLTPADASFDKTVVEGDTAAIAPDDAEELDRNQIGRYRVDSVLGKGSFGTVYLAWDADLQRKVAIKAPRLDRHKDLRDAEEFLREARILASLDHPRILPVLDVGRTEDGLCYVVWKFVEGQDLRARISQQPPTHTESVRLVAQVAEALHYAHENGLVHRDVKPANIIVDEHMEPMLIDFGLALQEQDIGQQEFMVVGTPTYMSPEQARAEGHLVDRRSDVFSLGVVLFQMLTGRKPFTGTSALAIMEQITWKEIRGLRQLNDAIPRELERICLRAIAKRARDRYQTAREFGEELTDLLKAMTLSGVVGGFSADESGRSLQSMSIDRPVRVVPRGLQSYDADDADFFLDLLPGSRSRDGLPESIRFWKNRIEEVNAAETFRVGLIYGPSGCGKSSLVKAGLFPRLAPDIVKVHVEATPDATEARLMNQLCKRCPEFTADTGLIAALSAIRRDEVSFSGRKMLIVIDQFEQWLSQKAEFAETELARALRQCDGEHIQCILMVRDEFWLSVSRLMLDLEIDLVPGENTALVDLFDREHARRILQSFGIAFGCLPHDPHKMTRQQDQFLDRAIQSLSRDGKVVSVQLAIFAEMFKSKEWIPSTLRALGGIDGVGVTFLEETFVSSAGPREYRQHQAGARSVLAALLPQHETDIKGHLRSAGELQEVAGYAGRDQEFRQLIRILESDLRVITPTDPMGNQNESEASNSVHSGVRHFQLTHDFLVPALRIWLTRKQKETFRGRTQLKFEEQTELWAAKPESRRLPSIVDWIRYVICIPRGHSSKSQIEMMNRATLVHLRNGLIALSLLVCMTIGVVEGLRRNRTDQFVEQLGTASPSTVLSIIREYSDYTLRAESDLRTMREASDESSDQHLNATLALLAIDSSLAPPLAERMLRADPVTSNTIITALTPYSDDVRDLLWERLTNNEARQTSQIRAAEAILTFYKVDPQEAAWQSHADLFAELLVSGVSATEFPGERTRLLHVFQPVRRHMLPRLTELFADNSQQIADSATTVLAVYAFDQPRVLAELIMLARPQQLQRLLPLNDNLGQEGEQILLDQVAQDFPDDADPDRQSHRQTNAAITLLKLGKTEHPKVWQCFMERPDPRLQVSIIHQCQIQNVPVEPLVEQLRNESDRTIRNGLVHTLGNYPRSRFESQDYLFLQERLAEMMGDATDPAAHASAEWALKQWEDHTTIQEGFEKLRNRVQEPDSRITLVHNDSVFVQFDGTSDPSIRRVFAICNKEVTQAEFTNCFKHSYYNRDRADSIECAASVVRFYQALMYCQWLNDQEHVPESEWCFKWITEQDVTDGKVDYSPDLTRTGYRLPTAAEWSFAYYGDTVTTYTFGESYATALQYEWLAQNSGGKIRKCGLLKPNPNGLFDMLGNVREWCSQPVDQKGFARTMGANWSSELDETRGHVTEAAKHPPQQNYDINGFRIARTIRSSGNTSK